MIDYNGLSYLSLEFIITIGILAIPLVVPLKNEIIRSLVYVLVVLSHLFYIYFWFAVFSRWPFDPRYLVIEESFGFLFLFPYFIALSFMDIVILIRYLLTHKIFTVKLIMCYLTLLVITFPLTATVMAIFTGSSYGYANDWPFTVEALAISLFEVGIAYILLSWRGVRSRTGRG